VRAERNLNAGARPDRRAPAAGDLAAVPYADDGALTDRDFERFRALVRDRSGIVLGPHKRSLLRARLDRRLRALALANFGQYYEYLTSGAHPDEVERFVNAITTNKTDFFREAHHFGFIAERWAPALRQAASRGGTRRLRVWSAACSTGEEPYTLAMTLLDAGLVPPEWDVRILASDIDTEVLGRARAGIYQAERVEPVPEPLRRRWFLRSRRDPGVLRVRPALQALITWKQINFIDEAWPVRGPFDMILCRNALIYFDRAGQRAILTRFQRLLKPDGVLILGHSESVLGLAEGFVNLGATIYRRAPGASV